MDKTKPGGFKVENTTGLGEMLLTQVTGTVGQPDNASEMEQELRRALMGLGRVVMGLWLARLEGRYPAKTVQCECGHEAKYVRKRAGRLHTMFGEVRYRRAYYLCSRCHGGIHPLDKQLGLRPNAMSADADAERLAGMMGYRWRLGRAARCLRN